MPGGPANDIKDPRFERRLAAVAFVDIVGYSIMMGRDEERTHHRWMDILEQVIRPQTGRYRGVIVKSTGDGVLAEFPSALDAVEWALEVQRGLRPGDAEGSLPALSLRIAVPVGDVMTTGFDVFGDGVDLAARRRGY